MKTLWEPEWHQILMKNLQNAIDLCNQAGIEILDEDDGEYKLVSASYSPAMKKTYFKTKAADNEKV